MFSEFNLTKMLFKVILYWSQSVNFRLLLYPLLLVKSIPVGYVPPTCQPYELQWPTLGVSTSGWGMSPKWTNLNRSPVMTTRCHYQGFVQRGVRYVWGVPVCDLHVMVPKPPLQIMEKKTPVKTLPSRTATIGCVAQNLPSISMVQRNSFTLVIVHCWLVRSSVGFLFRRIAQPFWNSMSLLW